MPISMYGSACTAYSKTRALVVGGGDQTSNVDQVYIYDHADEIFTPIAIMAAPAKNVRCVRHTLLEGKSGILCTAGAVASNVWSRHTYFFDIANERWEQLPSAWNLPLSVTGGGALIVVNGRVVYTPGLVLDEEVVDTATGTHWHARAPVTGGRIALDLKFLYT